MPASEIPTLYEWLGGLEALDRLTTRFYEHVRKDPLLGPVFEHMGDDHPAHVAASWLRSWAAPRRIQNNTAAIRT